MQDATGSSSTSLSYTSYDAEPQRSTLSADEQPLITHSPIQSSNSTAAELPDRSILSRLGLDRLFSAIWNSGVACIAIASLASSLGALSVKFLDGAVPIFEIVVVRSAICWFATDVLGRCQGIKPLYGTSSHYRLLLVRGVVGAFAMDAYYEALERLPLGDMMTLCFVYPAITVVLAWAVHGEAITWLAAVGCGVSLIGVALIAQPPFLFGHAAQHYDLSHWLGVASAFGNACGLAICVVAMRAIKKSETSLTVALWFHSWAVITSLPLLLMGYPDPAVMPSPRDCGLLFGVAMFSLVGQICLSRGFQIELAAKATAANYTQVLFAHIWGVAFLGEQEHLGGIAGSLLLAAGVVTVNLPKLGTTKEATAVASEPKSCEGNDIRILLGSPQGSKGGHCLEVAESQEVELCLSRA